MMCKISKKEKYDINMFLKNNLNKEKIYWHETRLSLYIKGWDLLLSIQIQDTNIDNIKITFKESFNTNYSKAVEDILNLVVPYSMNNTVEINFDIRRNHHFPVENLAFEDEIIKILSNKYIRYLKLSGVGRILDVFTLTSLDLCHLVKLSIDSEDTYNPVKIKTREVLRLNKLELDCHIDTWADFLLLLYIADLNYSRIICHDEVQALSYHKGLPSNLTLYTYSSPLEVLKKTEFPFQNVKLVQLSSLKENNLAVR